MADNNRYCYVFYHHCHTDDTEGYRQKVMNLFRKGNYDGFRELQEHYNSKEVNPKGWEYLPFDVWDREKNDGEFVPLTKAIFPLVNDFECECG